MKRIRALLETTDPKRVAPFMKGAEVFVRKIFGDFSNFDFYLNASMDPEAGIAIGYTNNPDTDMQCNSMRRRRVMLLT